MFCPLIHILSPTFSTLLCALARLASLSCINRSLCLVIPSLVLQWKALAGDWKAEENNMKNLLFRCPSGAQGAAGWPLLFYPESQLLPESPLHAATLFRFHSNSLLLTLQAKDGNSSPLFQLWPCCLSLLLRERLPPCTIVNSLSLKIAPPLTLLNYSI